MTQLIPTGKTRLLLVEGRDDKEFFIQLGKYLGFDDKTPLHIIEYGGKDGLSQRLFQLGQLPESDSISDIGIVRDADYETDAFQSAIDAIRTCNRHSEKHLPIPSSVLQVSDGRPRVSVLVVPDAGREGMLEDLVLEALKGDPVANCVDEYFACLLRSDIQVAGHRLPKARARVFISGKNAGADSFSDDSDKSYLSDIYKMSWWTANNLWDHPTFDDAKDFLRQLLAD